MMANMHNEATFTATIGDIRLLIRMSPNICVFWIHYYVLNYLALYVLTLFPVEHTSALDRAVVDITLSRFPARAGLTVWGVGQTDLDKNVAENIRLLPREGPC
jgi:hypothetical protein